MELQPVVQLLVTSGQTDEQGNCSPLIRQMFSLNTANVKALYTVKRWACLESKLSFLRSWKASYFLFYDFE